MPESFASGKFSNIISRLFKARDELSFRNIRSGIMPSLLVFPLSVILGNLRFYDHSIALAGFESYELVLFLLGFGWLVPVLIPKKFIIPVLRFATVVSAFLLPFQFVLPAGLMRLVFYIVFKFFNGLTAACAFFIFCFVLNNVERLAGMAVIQMYYSFYYTAWRTFPFVRTNAETWGAAIITLAFIAVVFLCRRESWSKLKIEIQTDFDGKESNVIFVLGLDIVYYMIVCMLNYIEWAEKSLSGFAFGTGTFISIALIVFIQLLKGRSALYIWFMFLAFSLLGLGVLLYENNVAFLAGSFIYGLGDGLGYIIIYYMCAGVIKRSKSFKMYRLYCIVFFLEYFIISGVFSLYFNYYEEQNKFLAFGVVLIIVSFSILLLPLMQKKLFDADWTDGLYLEDMMEYSKDFAETGELNIKNKLRLTPREHEIFTMLLTGLAPKEIAYTLKISYDTVCFHQKNLYRKLNIQSRAELFAKYALSSGKKLSQAKNYTGDET